MARKRLTEREVVGIVARQLGVAHVTGHCCLPHIECPICGCPIDFNDIKTLERDHDRAIGLLGEDDPEGCRFVHGHCHRLKTKQDIARIAKAKRQAGETGQRARRERRGSSSIQGRGFETNRDGAWKAKINARTEPRT